MRRRTSRRSLPTLPVLLVVPTAPRRRNQLPQRPVQPGLRRTLYDVIVESDTPAGRLFDIGLLIAIVGSIIVVAMETLPQFRTDRVWLRRLETAEFVFTGLFGIEYALRLYCSRYPWRYALSFWGLVDLMSFLPTLLVGVGAQRQRSFMILRSIRLLRVFRILKLWRMMRGADELSLAVWQAREKIVVFLTVVLVAITISSTLMYHVEYIEPLPGEQTTPSQFTSIPQAMYWAIVTMTTVGYGDIVPMTTAGKFVAAALILLGYSLIIVPSGFVSAELTSVKQQQAEAAHRKPRAAESDGLAGAGPAEPRICPKCGKGDHADLANYCDYCGTGLHS